MSTQFNKKSPESKNYSYNPEFQSVLPSHKHPVFCFRYTHKKFNVKSCDKIEKVRLLNKLDILSDMTWEQIKLSPRHGLGTEKINKDSLNFKCPDFITDDVDFLLAFRFNAKMPFLVWKDKFLAHIIFIDPKGKVYDH